MTAYREYLGRLSRINGEDYQDAGTQAHLAALAAPLDDLTTRTASVMLARLIAHAPEDALRLLGEERGLQRYPGEHLAAYRNRVLNAWTFWSQAGTLPGMVAALEHLGYGIRLDRLEDLGRGGYRVGGLVEETPTTFTLRGEGPVTEGEVYVAVGGRMFALPTFTVPEEYLYHASPPARVYEHYHDSRDIWAEFSIYLPPGRAEWTADPWDDGSAWDDGSTWDISFTEDERRRVLDVINLIKPAHARLRALYLLRTLATDAWDDGSTWNDTTVWEGDPPIELYRRPGL